MSASRNHTFDLPYSQSEETTVYFVKSSSSGHIKIGIAYDVQKRIKQFQTGNPDSIELIATVVCKTRDKALSLERALHVLYAQQNVSGEWVSVTRDDVDDLLQVAESYSDAFVVPQNIAETINQRLYSSFRQVLAHLQGGDPMGVVLATSIAEDVLKDVSGDDIAVRLAALGDKYALSKFFDGLWSGLFDSEGSECIDPFGGLADF